MKAVVTMKTVVSVKGVVSVNRSIPRGPPPAHAGPSPRNLRSGISGSKHQQQQDAFIIFDLDWFKQVNDQLGHLAGDAVISDMALSLQTVFRKTDIMGRIGGDEFVVLLPGIDATNIQMPLDKLRNVVKGIQFRFKDDKVEITISIGSTLFRSGDSPIEAFERADKALYEAKNGGRDRIIYAD